MLLELVYISILPPRNFVRQETEFSACSFECYAMNVCHFLLHDVMQISFFSNTAERMICV